jgi:hypothetical protein
MEKNTTALNRAIQRAKDQHNYYVEESLKDEYTDREKELLYVKSIALAEFIDTLAELLPVEREQMEDIFDKGVQGERYGDVDFEDYFTKTYTQK